MLDPAVLGTLIIGLDHAHRVQDGPAATTARRRATREPHRRAWRRVASAAFRWPSLTQRRPVDGATAP